MIDPRVRASARPVILFMDNDGARAVAQQVLIAKKLGFDTKVFERLLQFGNHLGELQEKDQADTVAAMVLDMHMPLEKSLAAIERPHVKTENGEAVGLAVVEGYLRDGDTPYSDVPVAFLSGRPIQRPIEERIARLAEDDPNDAVIVHKHEDHDFPIFEAFLEAALEKRRHEFAKQADAGAKPKNAAKAPRSQAWVQIATAANIIWELFDERAQRAGAFGLRSASIAEVEDIQRLATDYPSVDLHDRALLILDMKKRLARLSDNRLEVQRRWLEAKPPLLGGDRPIDLICAGHLHDLKRVVATLRLVTG